jgi:1-aminocyclopropane-1-carboxylate deaminase/D-cysteine desulfhydrase-like pyridoxal-dependent ACC family enzyme
MRALLGRYPRLAHSLARAELGVHETPVERWRLGAVTLLAKRDDLSAPAPGGNKVRALELLLAGVGPGQMLLTVGATGSTHALAVAEHGARLGARTQVITWPQETHPVALAEVTATRSVVAAYLRAAGRRARGGVHWVPAGGSVPLGALGHVNAALELADQLAQGGIPVPDTLVVPLGSGGTAAGLLVGLALAGLSTRVVGVRVVPRIVGNRTRVLGLAARTRALLARLTGVALPPLDRSRLEIDEEAYGGAYGRATAAARAAADDLRDVGGPPLDATYSAKAFGVALARARRAPDEHVLFWLTFDGRWLARGNDVPPATRPQPSPSP